MRNERPGVVVLLTLTLAVSLTLMAPPAAAREPRGGWRVAQEPARNADAVSISREQAAAIARDATGGRVLSVELQGGRTWRVKVLLDGKRVRTVRVDARSGAVQN